MSGKLANKKLFVLDMDGTIYIDGTPIEGAIEFVSYCKSHGIRIVYFTNNASRSIDMYYERLRRIGFPVDDGDVYSSADVTIDYLLRNHPGQSVYLVGTPPLEKSFREAGITLTDGSYADIVVSSFDTTVTYEKLNNACRLIREGSIFYSTHPDFNCPTETGFIPDSGAIAAFITSSTGVTPRYLGKPYAEVVDMIEEVTGVGRDELCVFGDRLYTDIETGLRSGMLSILVMSGETTEDMLAKSETKPDLKFGRLADMIPLL